MIAIVARVAAHLLFWTWNLWFLVVLWFGIGPFLLPELASETLAGEVPADFAAFLVATLGVPVFAVAVGWRLRRDAGALAAIFFGVEIPLLLLGLLRVFLVRELTPAVAALFGVLAVATAHLLWDRWRAPRSPAGSLARVVVATTSLAAGLYVGGLLGVFAPPSAVGAARLAGEVVEDLVVRGALLRILRRGELVVLPALALGVGTLAVLAVQPFAFAALHLAAFARAVRAARAHWSAAAVGVPAGLLAVGIAVVVGLARQPQHMAFALLSGEPATDAARAERLGRSETLRAGLLNAYLWRFRYVGRADEKVAWYTWKAHLGFGLDAAEWVWDVLAAPFQYEPRDGAGDEAFAGLAYADFFDCEIQRCEQDAVLHAVRATWSAEDRAAGALDVGRERVWLSRQEVAVEVDGDVGRFTIHEVYDNQTREEQEIRYTFSLPETAALTGLWLGDRDDLAARIPALLSPRGAAQAVYQRSVRRRVDPALLEQIGPRQYRLRVFPILPEKPMHLWLEGVALAGEHGVPLPVLGERRNVYWTDATERRVDAVPATTDGWLPTHVGRAGEPRSHAFALPDGRRVDATPIAEVGRTPWKGGRYAMVLDRSRSMERRRAEVAEAFDWAREALEPGSTVDLYLTSSASRGEAPVRRAGLAGFDPAAVVWYGALAPDELVAQFASLAGEDCYDAVFVLTDDAARPRDGAPPEVDSPLWMVHLGGAMGPGYDDATTEIVRASGGGAATSLHEAALHASGRTGDTWEADGYRFTVGDGPVEADPAFAPIAAVQRIRALDTPHPDLATLDAVHALATAAHVVTPFTSMIVLPEAWQREALADAEKRSDRFDREVEDDAETLAAPGSISAVPEPATWILGGIGAAILAVRRRLRAV